MKTFALPVALSLGFFALGACRQETVPDEEDPTLPDGGGTVEARVPGDSSTPSARWVPTLAVAVLKAKAVAGGADIDRGPCPRSSAK